MESQNAGHEPGEEEDLAHLAGHRRLLAVARLGALERLGDPVLTRLARLAQSVSGASAAAVHIFDDKYQRRIAAAGVPLVDIPAQETYCQVVVKDGTRIITPDAPRDPRLADTPPARADQPFHFYAGLPLKVAGDVTVGTLCAFDAESLEMTPEQVASLEDIALLVRTHLELMQIAGDLSRDAARDGLTGVTTRVIFDGLLGRALADRRRDGHDVLVCVVDLDDFKSINDLHGHDVGDQALRFIGGRLSELVGPDGAVGRLGGDEFALLMRVSGAEADGFMNAVRYASQGFEPDFGISVGSTFANDDDDVSSLLRRADMGMYAAKAARGVPHPRF